MVLYQKKKKTPIMVLIEKKNNFLFWGVKGVVSTEEPKIS
jgi:hypothetical protein